MPVLQVFSCSVCKEAFKKRVELRLHMVSHTGEMPYKVSSSCRRLLGVEWAQPGRAAQCRSSVRAIPRL